MKRIRLLFALFFISQQLIWSQNNQIIYEQINEKDTALIQLPEYSGDLHWQCSSDNLSWADIIGETSESLLIVVEKNQYYRAKVILGSCEPFYSNITFIENGSAIDDDLDGLSENQGDCDDSNPEIFFGNIEICDDQIDQDCSGQDLDCDDVDNDNDGFTENQGDCDDNDPSRNPGATENTCCDGIDLNCDGKDCNAIYQDEPFDLLNDRWLIQIYGFYGNGSNMIAENVNVDNSILSLSVTLNENPTLPLKYNAGEIGDSAYHMYGYFEVRMKPDIVSGTVASFYIMNRWIPENWEHREIDIEFTGNKLTSMQMTIHDYGEGGNNYKFSTTIKELGFDITQEFHNYGILWTADSVSWYVDGELFHTEKQYVPHDPLHIRLNHWAGDMDAGMDLWLGPIDDNTLPSVTYYEWIKVMTLEGFFAEKERGCR
jgi:beta-glucanase (GH16 family)